MLLTPRRLNLSDFKGAPDWMPSLVSTLNLQQNDQQQLINGALTVGDNINGQVSSLTFTVPTSGYLTGSFPAVSFTYNGKTLPKNVIIGQITCTNGKTILLPTSLQWTYNNNVSPPTISITYVTGLTAGLTYNLTVLCI